jgi:hypothetical protein
VTVAGEVSSHRGAVADVRDMAAVAPSTIDWTVTAGGVLAFSGPVCEVLGQLPGADLTQQMEAVLAPT